MFGHWRKIRSDRKLWAAALSLSEMGDLMARWLEGELSSWPGYAPGHGPDEETTDLVPVLAGLNRAGFVTDQSQPGLADQHWQQRAAVSGLIGDVTLLKQVVAAVEAAGLTVVVHSPGSSPQTGPVVATLVEDFPYTAFGGHLSARQLRFTWQWCNGRALSDVMTAWQVAFIDPDYGRNDRLWAVLDAAVAASPSTPNPIGPHMPQQPEHTDLTTPEAVAVGEQVYAQMAPGQDVTAQLDTAYGRDTK